MALTPQTPAWLDAVVGCGKAREHVVLTGNTRDRVYIPGLRPFGAAPDTAEAAIPPQFFPQFLALYFGREYQVYCYSPDLKLIKMLPPGYPDRSTGVDQLTNGRSEEVLPELTRHLREDSQPIVLVVDNAQDVIPNTQGMQVALSQEQIIRFETLARWASDDAIRRTRNLVILIDHDGTVNSGLTQQGTYRQIYVPLPGALERRGLLDYLLDLRAHGRTEFADLPSDQLEFIATESSGLRHIDIEALSRQSAASGRPVTREIVRRRKEQTIIQLSGGLLELVEADYGLEAIVGQPHVVDELRQIVAQWKMGDPNVPKGVLLAGVPGQGKSFTAAAFGHDLGIPALKLKNLRGPFVGESESRQERVFQLLDSLAPVLVEIDEVDQAVGRRAGGPSGDSGTSERMFGAFLEWFGAEARRGKVILVAASNHPMSLDAALVDRFGVVLPFLPPAASDVAQLIPAVARQRRVALADDVDLDTISRMPNLQYPTVRTLAEMLATAGRWAAGDAGHSGAPIPAQTLAQAAASVRPNYDPLTMEHIALESIRMTTFEHLLPWRTRCGKREGYEPPPYVRDMIDASGYLDNIALERRVNELRRARGV